MLQQCIQLLVAVPAIVTTTEAIGSRGNLVTGEQRRVICIVRPGIFKLADVKLAIRQNASEVGIGRIVLDIELHTNRLEVLLQDRLIGSTPGIVRRRRIHELQPLAVL